MWKNQVSRWIGITMGGKNDLNEGYNQSEKMKKNEVRIWKYEIFLYLELRKYLSWVITIHYLHTSTVQVRQSYILQGALKRVMP